LASDSTSLANLLAFFPGLDKELDLAFKDAVGRVFRPNFQHSKEQVILAEVFFKKKPDLTEDDRRKLVDLIKGAGGFKELKARLKSWGSSSTGGLTALWSGFTSLFFSKEWTSESINEATEKSRAIKDFEFLAALQDKVSREPLLGQLTQNVMTEVHAHFQDFMKQRLPKLYFYAQNIKQKAMYHQVEAEATNQDQQMRMASRSNFFDDVKMAQAQANPGCVLHYLQVYSN